MASPPVHPPSKNLEPADDDGAGPDVNQYYYWDGTRSVAIGRAVFINLCRNASMFTQASMYSVRITGSQYLTVGSLGDVQDIVHRQAVCSSTTRISLDKAAAAVEEKFRTTTSAPMPSLAECARMTRAEAVALAGKICRVPFTFVVAPTTVAPAPGIRP